MFDSSVFLALSGHSVRLVFSVDQLVDKYWAHPRIGIPGDQDEARRHADELEAFDIKPV